MRYVPLFILVLTSLASCSNHTREFTIHNEYYKVSDTVTYSDFQVIFDGGDDLFSSIDSSFTRLYMSGTEKIKTFLQIDEKKKILEIMKKNGFLELPDVLAEDKKGECTLPCFPTKVTVTIGKRKKSVYYSGECPVKDPEVSRRFNEIDSVVTLIIFHKKEILEMKQSDILYM
jgi:hypothetical protein